MRLILTDHAIDRFCQRVAPEIPADQARTLLEELLPTARLLKGRTTKGTRRYVIADPRCILVVRNAREDREQLIVTILGPGEDEAAGPKQAPPVPRVDLTVGAALQALLDAWGAAPAEPPPEDLVTALCRLSLAMRGEPVAERSAAALLRGFSILAARPAGERKRAKLGRLRDDLREILGCALPAADAEVEELWADVVALARRQIRLHRRKDRQAWMATAAAWAEGLAAISRGK